MAHFSSYSDKYSFIKMERRDGVLKATIHAEERCGEMERARRRAARRIGRRFLSDRP